MTRFHHPSTYRRLRVRIGRIAVLIALLACALPADVRAQSPVQSLVEQAEQAGADTDLMRTVVARAKESGLDPDATADLLRPAVTLAKNDLPTTPLLTKTLEGLAKRVPVDRMVPVLQQLQADTQSAGTLVSTWQMQEPTQGLPGGRDGAASKRDRLITAIAEARQQEVPLDHIEGFLNDLPEAVSEQSVSLGDVSIAVRVLSDLPGARDNPKPARQLLTTALSAGYDAASLRQLPAALKQAQHTSNRPALALTKGAADAIARGQPASRVVQTLSHGSLPSGQPPKSVGNASPGTAPGSGKPPGRGGRPPGSDSPGERPPVGDGPPDDPPGDGPPDDPPGDGPPDDTPGNGPPDDTPGNGPPDDTPGNGPPDDTPGNGPPNNAPNQ